MDDREGNAEIIREFMAKIKKFNPEYQERAVDTSSAGPCYVATAVYGSYDCPEVWTLRRFPVITLSRKLGMDVLSLALTMQSAPNPQNGSLNLQSLKDLSAPLDKLVRNLQPMALSLHPIKIANSNYKYT